MSSTFHNEIFFDRYFSTCFGLCELPEKGPTFEAYQKLYGDWLPANKDASILDLGAGLGLVVAWLREIGFQNVLGIEPSREQCEVARERYGIELLETKAIDIYLSANCGRFDLVFLTDVIEHVPKASMSTYLSKIRQVLKPGGSLILRTENMSSPIGAFQYRMDFTHEYCFTEMSLRQILTAVGFHDIVIRGEPYSVGRRPKALKRAVIRWLWWGLLKQLYEAERPMSANPRIFSKSLVATCQRPWP